MARNVEFTAFGVEESAREDPYVSPQALGGRSLRWHAAIWRVRGEATLESVLPGGGIEPGLAAEMVVDGRDIGLGAPADINNAGVAKTFFREKDTGSMQKTLPRFLAIHTEEGTHRGIRC